VRQRVTFYVTEDQLGYLHRQATRRRISLSSYIAQCVLDYHQQIPEADQTQLAPSPPFDVLLRESEQRLAAQIAKSNAAEASQLGKQLTTLTAMLDRFVLSALVHTPEIPTDLRARAIESAERRYSKWREAVTELLDTIETPRHSKLNNGQAHGIQEDPR
jgi:hypothetical protein